MSELYDEDDSTWPIVICQWTDAHSGGEAWTSTAEYRPEEVYVLTTGWVWPKCLEGHLTIVGSCVGEPNFPESVGSITHIPWANVISLFSITMHVPIQWTAEEF